MTVPKQMIMRISILSPMDSIIIFANVAFLATSNIETNSALYGKRVALYDDLKFHNKGAPQKYKMYACSKFHLFLLPEKSLSETPSKLRQNMFIFDSKLKA
jgi:hypothetical protein